MTVMIKGGSVHLRTRIARSSGVYKNSKVFWGIEDNAMKFDPKGVGWKQAISQMNFVGTDSGLTMMLKLILNL